MRSSGATGALSIREALREMEGHGYEGEFLARPGGLLQCRGCKKALRARDVSLEAMRRIEGESDPADMALVGALRCPLCDRTGTIVLKFGPDATPEEGDILRELENHRKSTRLSLKAESESHDHSLVRDTGWLSGPNSG